MLYGAELVPVTQSRRLGLKAVSRPVKASVLSQTDWQTPRSRNWGSRSWYQSQTVRLLTHLCNNVAVICTSNSLTYIYIWDRSWGRRKLSCLERFLFPWCTSYIGCFILPVMGHLELRFTTVTRLWWTSQASGSTNTVTCQWWLVLCLAILSHCRSNSVSAQFDGQELQQCAREIENEEWLKGSVKEPNMFHNYEIEKITRKASVVAESMQL